MQDTIAKLINHTKIRANARNSTEEEIEVLNQIIKELIPFSNILEDTRYLEMKLWLKKMKYIANICGANNFSIKQMLDCPIVLLEGYLENEKFIRSSQDWEVFMRRKNQAISDIQFAISTLKGHYTYIQVARSLISFDAIVLAEKLIRHDRKHFAKLIKWFDFLKYYEKEKFEVNEFFSDTFLLGGYDQFERDVLQHKKNTKKSNNVSKKSVCL